MSEANPAATGTPSAAEAPQGNTVLTASAAPAQQPTPNESANAQATEQKPPEQKPDVKYELKIPDGSPLDASVLAEVEAFAKEKGISPEIAQAIVEKQHAAASAYATKLASEYEATKAKWVSAVQTDKEIGGEAFKGNVEIAHRAMKAFASDEFVSILETTGLGNHPELVRVFYRIGKQMADDKLVTGAQAQPKKSAAEAFYGKS
jgi:hypothetical protein